MESSSSAFGLLLKRFRGRAGLTQEALAVRAGLNLQTITKLERGVHHRPHTETVQVIASALHLLPQERAYLERAALLRPMSRRPGSGGHGGLEEELLTAIDAVLHTLATVQARRPMLVDVFVSVCPDEVSALEGDAVRLTILS